jgi:hypothetical protein
MQYKYDEIEKFDFEKKKEQPQERNTTAAFDDAQKMMLYESQKKNPTMAVAYSCLLPSAGHAYAENWGRGLLFTGGRVLCSVLAITQGIKTETVEYGWGQSYEEVKVTDMYYIGIGGALVLGIWEMFDASSEVTKYNQRLYKRIVLGEPDLGMTLTPSIIPTKNGAKFMLALNF